MLNKVESAIGRPLPAISDIVGDVSRGDKSASVAIGYLINDEKAEGLDWGSAIGWYLMEMANGMHQNMSIVPSYQFNSDGRDDNREGFGSRAVVLRRVAERTGSRLGITGDIEVREDNFKLHMRLVEFPTNRVISTVQKSGSLATISTAVSDAATQTFFSIADSLKYTPSDFTAAFPAPAPSELRTLASWFSKTGVESADKIFAEAANLWREHPEFKSFGMLYLYALSKTKNTEGSRAALRIFLQKSDLTLNQQVFGNHQLSYWAANGLDAAALTRLKKVVNANAAAVGPWLALSGAFEGEQVMYAETEKGRRYVISPAIDHHEGYASAVAVALEATRRWPDHYRTWWVLSDSLSTYSGAVRGTKYWQDVPEEAKIRYKDMNEVAEACLRQAMKRHPFQSALHTSKIQFEVSAGTEWMTTFRRAAELEPHWQQPYAVAFNYARPQWGGTKDQLREIYELAKNNNPDATWPQDLRDIWAPEIKPLFGLEGWQRMVAIIVVICVAIIGCWRIARSR